MFVPCHVLRAACAIASAALSLSLLVGQAVAQSQPQGVGVACPHHPQQRRPGHQVINRGQRQPPVMAGYYRQRRLDTQAAPARRPMHWHG